MTSSSSRSLTGSAGKWINAGIAPIAELFHFFHFQATLRRLSIIQGSGRSQHLVPTAVNRVLAEIREAQAGGRTVVSLMRGEPDFDTPAHIVEAAARAMKAGRTRYPDNRGEMPLREAVAAKLARDNGITYDPGSEILVTTGATLGIYVALMAVVNDGDEVLLPDPIYDAYRSPIALAGGCARPVRSSIDDGRFTLTADAIESALTSKSRVLLLNTPWNPVGTVMRRHELEAIADLVIRRGLTLLSDEIYEAITYNGSTHLSPAALAPEAKAHTIVINSLSKTYAMTGWRVGYCAAPAPITQAMFLHLQQASRGPATFIQDAAAVALTGPQDAVADMRTEYAGRRQRVLAALASVRRVRVLAPEGGFFAMVDARDTGVLSDEIRKRLLLDAGVAVIHGAAYGPGGEGTLRVSFASGGETLTRGLDRLREGLGAL
ncbi:MAG TPA: pyridoxal phosphate-dependent aminotransferase [Vicinamibacterales bacterium]|nr:pyridoxal phosphate-dependent aminotransferase [Vicinamibacterales bacterium]